MEFVVGVLVLGLITAVGFGCYMWADSIGSRKLVEWNERTNPSTAVIDAIRQSQTQSQEMVATISGMLAASTRSMLGLDNTEATKPEYEEEVVDPVAKPFAEWDPYMNDDVDLEPDTMRPDYAL